MASHHTLISNLQIYSKFIEHVDAYPAANPANIQTILVLSDKAKTFDLKVEGALVKHAVFNTTATGECSLHHCSELFSFISSGRKRPGGIIIISIGETQGPVLLKLLVGSYLMKRRALTLQQTKVLLYNRTDKKLELLSAESAVLEAWKENPKNPHLNDMVRNALAPSSAVAAGADATKEAEAAKRAEEEAAAKKKNADQEAEDAAKKKAGEDAEAAKKAEDAKKKAEQEAEEAATKKAEEEAAAKKKAEQEAEEAASKKKAEEEAEAANQKSAQEAVSVEPAAVEPANDVAESAQNAEEEAAAAKKKADEEEAAKKDAEEEAEKKKKADADAAAKKKVDEDAAAKKKADEDAATQKKADEDAAAKKKDDNLRASQQKGKKVRGTSSPRKNKGEEDLTGSQKGSMFSRLKKKMTKKKDTEKASGSAPLSRNSIKLKKLEDAPPVQSKEIIEVTCYEDLPKEFQSKVKDAKIPQHLIVEHFFYLLNVLHFQSKRVFQYHNTVTNQTQITATSPGDPIEVKEEPMDFEKEEAELLNHSAVVTKLYKLGREMGKGGFGSVFAGTSRDKAKTKCAIKVLKHERSKLKKYNLKEIRFLKEYPHDNIVQFIDAFKLSNKDKPELWIIMEMMNGGTLTEAVKAHQFTEPQMAYLAEGVLLAIAYLHENDIVHRDLKSANVMLTVEGYVKIIDFGLCCNVKTGPKLHMVGSPFWMPPEMIRRQPHSFPADIWSFAICMLELANNDIPDRRSGLYAMFVHACVGIETPFDDPELFSDAMAAFYDSALRVDPEERGTAKQLLKHEWIKQAATHSSMKKVLSKVFVNNALDMLDLGGGF